MVRSRLKTSYFLFTITVFKQGHNSVVHSPAPHNDWAIQRLIAKKPCRGKTNDAQCKPSVRSL